jgi:hypothetical protein
MAHPTTPADLAKDGIIIGLAEICVQALKEAAAVATPERLIELVSQQVTASTGELSAELVAKRLQETATASKALAAELHWAGRECRA